MTCQLRYWDGPRYSRYYNGTPTGENIGVGRTRIRWGSPGSSGSFRVGSFGSTSFWMGYYTQYHILCRMHSNGSSIAKYMVSEK